MKRVFTVIMATCAISFGFNNSATAQVEEGNMIVDLYYGYPNVGKSFWSVLETDSTSGKATGFGPIGGRFEYMIADNFGIGIEVNYVANGYSYDADVNVFDTVTSTFVTNTYNYAYKKNKLRIMARMNYHFVQTDVVDAYLGFGAGYKNKSNVFTSTDPNATEVDFGITLLPVTLRVALGARFFFTDMIGINAEMGLGGGPLLSGGLSLKF